MAKKVPGLIDDFKGLWVRGSMDDCPPDHFVDSLNNTFVNYGVGSRDAAVRYKGDAPLLPDGTSPTIDVVRMVLYKPNPPFGGTTIPRELILKSNGQLIDLVLGQVLHTNSDWKDIACVNFFGRCYISPNDGKVGIAGESVWVYDGTGTAGFRLAAGPAPTDVLVGAYIPAGHLTQGTYIFTYAFETASGFITAPGPRLVLSSHFGDQKVNFTSIPLGPAGTKARWLIATKLIPELPFPPFDFSYNGNPDGYPFYFATRIGDNVTITFVLDFFDENLVNSSDYLLSNLVTIPAGVGLADYKGRMASWGENANPTLVRLSAPGEPESFSATSGFIITDPTDNTGVRACTEYRNNFFIFKRQRGYITDDNGGEPSTWDTVNFEKALGTEHDGIASILDAKGSSSVGFIVAATNGLHFYNGAFADPPLSYKIEDLWLSINPNYFSLVEVIQDPENKRIYILAPIGDSTTRNFLIYGDYRDGLSPLGIKWDKWQLPDDFTSLLVYEDFTSAGNLPHLVARVATTKKIYTLDVDSPGKDDDVFYNSFFTLGPIRFGEGISSFNRVRLRAFGPATINLLANGQDLVTQNSLRPLVVESDKPGKEFTVPMNHVNEQCLLKISHNGVLTAVNKSTRYGINLVQLYGSVLWNERPR